MNQEGRNLANVLAVVDAYRGAHWLATDSKERAFPEGTLPTTHCTHSTPLWGLRVEYFELRQTLCFWIFHLHFVRHVTLHLTMCLHIAGMLCQSTGFPQEVHWSSSTLQWVVIQNHHRWRWKTDCSQERPDLHHSRFCRLVLCICTTGCSELTEKIWKSMCVPLVYSWIQNCVQ